MDQVGPGRDLGTTKENRSPQRFQARSTTSKNFRAPRATSLKDVKPCLYLVIQPVDT